MRYGVRLMIMNAAPSDAESVTWACKLQRPKVKAFPGICMRISVIGLGKLGAPLAAVLADHGHEVTGVDTRSEVVHLVNEGRSPVDETGLAELIARNTNRLRATVDITAAVAQTDLTFIIVP